MNLLSIGGSDPSSGAGIQGDIKTFSSFGAHCLTVVTALTSQNTSRFGTVEPVSQDMLEQQLDFIISDFHIDGIKIGMVHNSRTIKTLYHKLEGMQTEIPIVVDPVIKSTTGGDLLEVSAIDDFRRYMIPLATVITPNLYEAAAISGMQASQQNAHLKIASAIREMGAQNIVITGLARPKHGGSDGMMSDLVLDSGNVAWEIPGDLITGITHGGGCGHSAAVLVGLAEGKMVDESLVLARRFALDSIRNAKSLGRGIAITVPAHDADPTASALSHAINRFIMIRGIFRYIPECQTNFVYSQRRPTSVSEIMGLKGRIVRTGTSTSVAGDLAYGGSKHVATAMLAVNRMYRQVLSAINIRYSDDVVLKIRRAGLTVLNYNRRREPNDVKSAGSSIEWGIGDAIQGTTDTPPDAIYHLGDMGKEPMIIVFGMDPDDVVHKIEAIISQ